MKELEDHTWFPTFLRNFQTDFIGFVASRFGLYECFIRHLDTLTLPLKPLTDLCSGSGVAIAEIFRKAANFTRLTLTDKFPSQSAARGEKISYEKNSVDVLKIEFSNDSYYTMLNSFHHFNDEEKLLITERICHAGATAFIVEILEPTMICFLKVFFTTTIGCLLFTPFIAPFSFTRFFFTYILPLNLITITFDGMVSVFKSRSVRHYQKLFMGLPDVSVIRLKSCMHPLILISINSKIESARHTLEIQPAAHRDR